MVHHFIGGCVCSQISKSSSVLRDTLLIFVVVPTDKISTKLRTGKFHRQLERTDAEVTAGAGGYYSWYLPVNFGFFKSLSNEVVLPKNCENGYKIETYIRFHQNTLWKHNKSTETV